MVEKLPGSVSVSENEQATGKASGDPRGSWPWWQADVIRACLPRRHRPRGAGRPREAARVAHAAHQGPCLPSGRAAPCPRPPHGAALGTSDLGAPLSTRGAHFARGGLREEEGGSSRLIHIWQLLRAWDEELSEAPSILVAVADSIL